MTFDAVRVGSCGLRLGAVLGAAMPTACTVCPGSKDPQRSSIQRRNDERRNHGDS